MKANFLKVCIVVVAVLLYMSITIHPVLELTRYILAFIEAYGEVPQFTPNNFILEIVWMWATYSIGAVLFGTVLWKYVKREG